MTDTSSTLIPKIIVPQPNDIEHRQLYQALKSSPILLQYLRGTLYSNAMELLHAPLPILADDLRYVTAHAQSRGVCQLAEALLNIVEEGDKNYAPGK